MGTAPARPRSAEEAVGVKPAVFLTGATGFLGMEVLARLLEAGDREVARAGARRRRRRRRARLDGVLETLWDDPVAYR